MLEAPVLFSGDIPCSEQESLSDQDAQQIFDFIAKKLTVDPSSVKLSIVDEESFPSNLSGFYVPSDEPETDGVNATIFLPDSELKNINGTVKALGHELARAALIGGNLIEADEPDLELVTDLLPVYFGFGLFTANFTTQYSQWSEGEFGYHQWSKKGYLSSEALGHALALMAWFRGEKKPSWMSHLRTDSRNTMAGSLKYFDRTGDSAVSPSEMKTSHEFPVPLDVEIAAQSSSVSMRLAALWELPNNPIAMHILTRLLDDKDRLVFREALTTTQMAVRTGNSLDGDTKTAVEKHLNDRDPACQLQALLILIESQSVTREAIEVLIFLMASDPWRKTPVRDNGTQISRPSHLSEACYDHYAYLVAYAAAQVLEHDTTMLEDSRVVDSIVTLSIFVHESRQPGWDSDESAAGAAHVTHLMLKHVENLPLVLKERFSHLAADEVSGIIDLATNEPEEVSEGES